MVRDRYGTEVKAGDHLIYLTNTGYGVRAERRIVKAVMKQDKDWGKDEFKLKVSNPDRKSTHVGLIHNFNKIIKAAKWKSK